MPRAVNYFVGWFMVAKMGERLERIVSEFLRWEKIVTFYFSELGH